MLVGTLLGAAAANRADAQARHFQAPLSCNRACLIDLADRYLAALVAHDTKAVPLASNFLR